jgi:hypothetical protein
VAARIKGLDARIGLCLDIGLHSAAPASTLGRRRSVLDRPDVHVKDVTSASRGRAIDRPRRHRHPPFLAT